MCLACICKAFAALKLKSRHLRSLRVVEEIQTLFNSKHWRLSTKLETLTLISSGGRCFFLIFRHEIVLDEACRYRLESPGKCALEISKHHHLIC